MRIRERGVAVITALLIVAIAAAAAALMLSQQSAMLDQTAMVMARAQAEAYAQAGVDWARGVLTQDARTSQLDSLDEGWAQPIPALPVERAVVSGQIVDEQGKFNVNNLVLPGHVGEDDRLFRDLLGLAGLSPELIGTVRDWIDEDSDLSLEGGAEDAYYLGLARPYRAANRPMAQVDELYRVRGFDAAAVARLRPYVTALPVHTTINVNTASDVVLAALVGAPQRLEVAPLVALRAKKAFASPDDFTREVLKTLNRSLTSSLPGVSSNHFSVRVQVAQDDVQLATEALIQRQADKSSVLLWRRPRY